MKNKKTIIIVISIVLFIVIGLVAFNIIKNNDNQDNTNTQEDNKQEDNKKPNNSEDTDKDENESVEPETKPEENVKPEDNVKPENGEKPEEENVVPAENFYFYVEDIYSISGQGTVVTGKIKSGSIYVNNAIEILGLQETKNSKIKKIYSNHKEVTSAKANDKVEILIEGLTRKDVKKGQVVATPGTLKNGKQFKANVSLYSKKDGGKSLLNGSNITFQFNEAAIPGKIVFPEDLKILDAGEKSSATLKFDLPYPALKNQKFLITDNDKIIGIGTVEELIEE